MDIIGEVQPVQPSHKLLVRGERLNTIACISMEGVLECSTVTGTVDGNNFYTFVHSKLLPLLMRSCPSMEVIHTA